MDKNNIDPKQLNGLLNAVSKKIGVPPEQLRKELEEGKFDSALAGMNKNEADKFRMAVNNPKVIEKLMSTPQAKALYEKLSGKKQGAVLDDIMNKISGILSDEESMKQIAELAKMFQSGELNSSSSEVSEDCPPDDTMPDMEQIMSLVSLANSLNQQDKNTQLLLALRPHLSEGKQVKLDKAVKMLKLVTIYNTAKENGLLNNILQEAENVGLL